MFASRIARLAALATVKNITPRGILTVKMDSNMKIITSCTDKQCKLALCHDDMRINHQIYLYYCDTCKTNISATFWKNDGVRFSISLMNIK